MFSNNKDAFQKFLDCARTHTHTLECFMSQFHIPLSLTCSDTYDVMPFKLGMMLNATCLFMFEWCLSSLKFTGFQDG